MKFLILAFLLSLCACEGERQVFKIENIQQVFYEGSQGFAAEQVDFETKRIRIFHIPHVCYGSPNIIMDIDESKPMWAYYTQYTGNYYCSEYVEIHLHKLDDIKGGHWDNGKFGNGNISVIK